MNKIFYSTEFIKQIKKYNKDLQTQIVKKLKQLETNSELGKPLSNVLKNNGSLHIGKYRVLYSIKGEEIIIAKVDHRKDVYE
jgi:mRNA interferase RelE/StbE